MKWSEDLSAGHGHSDLPVVWPFSWHSIFRDFVKIFCPNLLIVEQIFTSCITAVVVVSRIELETILDKGYSSMNMLLSFALQKNLNSFILVLQCLAGGEKISLGKTCFCGHVRRMFQNIVQLNSCP